MTVECPLWLEPGPRAAPESRLVHVAIGDKRSAKSFANFSLGPVTEGPSEKSTSTAPVSNGRRRLLKY